MDETLSEHDGQMRQSHQAPLSINASQPTTPSDCSSSTQVALESGVAISPRHDRLYVGTRRASPLAPDLHQISMPCGSEIPEGYVGLGTIRLYRAVIDQALPFNDWTMKGSRGADSTFATTSATALTQKGLLKFENLPDSSAETILRLHVKPEDRHINISRSLLDEYRRFLKHMLPFIDTSKDTWYDRHDRDSIVETYFDHGSDNESLFYIFNTLQSPRPGVEHVSDTYGHQAMEDILHGPVQGLVTKLYPYQRRSAAMMVQRETAPKKSSDPRMPLYEGPLGQSIYIDKELGILRSEPYLYDEPAGGILAETMGYGKTLICLALILATRGHFPNIPGDRTEPEPRLNDRTPTLLEMAARQAGSSGVPWKAEFHALGQRGYTYEKCINELKKNVKEYSEPIFNPTTPSRNGKRLSDRFIKLCSTTLVILPPNLLVQWQHEIKHHTEAGALDILVIDHGTKHIPHSSELVKHDVVLITKARFEQEYRDNDLHEGKRRKGEERFQSSLCDVRWLRVICDEGHSFAGSGSSTNAMTMLNKMYIERKWVVSGTPSNSLLGVEVALASDEVLQDQLTPTKSTAKVLQSRRAPDAMDQERKDLEKLKTIVVSFLKVRPWANTAGQDRANFSTYLSQKSALDRGGQRRKTKELRTLLQSLIVRHRIEDIEADLSLPPLYNRVAFLEPSFYDKLSINLFISVLSSNAITSERTDQDYMFHPRNRKQLDLLISNLRHSSFHWVGFKDTDLLEALRISNAYLQETADRDHDRDRADLLDAISISGFAIEDPGWRGFSTLHEIGIFVEGFPDHASEAWALTGRSSEPLLLGTVQARNAQQHVRGRLGDADPAEGLVGAGIRAMQAARKRAAEEDEEAAKNKAASGASQEQKLKEIATSMGVQPSTFKETLSRKRTQSTIRPVTLNPGSPLTNTKIVGFSSAKLSYLIDQVLQHQESEKIIIFYDAQNIAFWVAEALEVLSVKFLIYSNTLTVARRATYLQTFNQKQDFRVLLMDLKQAAHGLHVAAASRVYIISPIWQPTIESQAIKRAHRIGQTRPVYVETLILKDTLEDRMLRRRKQMSNLELQKSEKSLLDDSTMSQLIKEERFISFKAEEMPIAGRVARLRDPQPLFGQAFSARDPDNPREGLVLAAGDSLSRGDRKAGTLAARRASVEPQKKRKKAAINRQTHPTPSTSPLFIGTHKVTLPAAPPTPMASPITPPPLAETDQTSIFFILND